jgi:hypothetical protein
MKLKIYSVYDSKVEAYLQPFFMQAKGAAIRAFSDTVQDSSNNFGKHPEDYTLFELGTWDDTNASYVPHSTPISIGVGIEFIKNS